MAMRRATPHFRVSEFDDGTCFIVVENSGGDDLNFLKGLASFRLPPGTSMERAQEVAGYLRDNIIQIAEQD